MAHTRVPLHRKARADHDRAQAIISSLRLELEEWSPAFTDLLGPDDEGFLWILFDPSPELPRALRLTYCAVSKVADDWERHFDPPGPSGRAIRPDG